MKKISKLFSVMLIVVLLILPSCGDDPIPKSTIDFDPDQFDGGEMTVSESNGSITSFHPLLYQDANGNTGTGVDYELTLNLSRAAAETTVIKFATSGTATLSTATVVGDYSLGLEGDLLVIKKGDKSVNIPFTVYEDYDFEIDSQDALSETFTITLKEIVSGPGKLGANASFDVHILEDDLIVYLDWSATGEDPLPANPNKGDVDLDMFIWLNNNVIATLNTVGTDAEGINIPGGFPSGTYGYSYTYYEGTSDNVKFYVEFDNFGGSINGTTGTPAYKIYKKTYTTANINVYDDANNGQDPFIAQTGTKSVFNYIFSDVTVNSSGSRLGESNNSFSKSLTSKLPIKKIDSRTMQLLRKFN